MWNKIKEVINQILPIAILVLVLLLIVNQCNGSARYLEQLTSLGTTIGNLKQSIESIGDGVRQQESIITELTECQSRIESTVNELAGAVQKSNGYLEQLVSDESAVDGSVGAIRGTVHRLESTISTTIEGIEQTGVQ